MLRGRLEDQFGKAAAAVAYAQPVPVAPGAGTGPVAGNLCPTPVPASLLVPGVQERGWEIGRCTKDGAESKTMFQEFENGVEKVVAVAVAAASSEERQDQSIWPCTFQLRS